MGNLLFLSGIGPRERGQQRNPRRRARRGRQDVDYDIEAQCRASFDNVRVILEDAGARWEDLVDVTVFLTDMKADFAAYNRLWAEYFADAQPCRTTVEVTRCPRRSPSS